MNRHDADSSIDHNTAATSVEHGHLCWLARAALEGVAVVFEDERVKYVEVQLDREDWLRWKEATDG